MIDFPMDGAPSNGCSTTTIFARPFIEPDAARAPSTPSHQPFLLIITWLSAGVGFNKFNALAIGDERRVRLFLLDVTMPRWHHQFLRGS